MTVTAIMSSSNKFYYSKRETSIKSTVDQNSKEENSFQETQGDSEENNTQNNSATYVRNAYAVSFRPLDMIVNLQIVQI